VTVAGRHGSQVAVYCPNCQLEIAEPKEDFKEYTIEQLFNSIAERWNKRTPI